MPDSNIPPYAPASQRSDVVALVAAAVAGLCGAITLMVRRGLLVADALDHSTVHVVSLVVCPTALAVLAMALQRHRRRQQDGLAVWLFGIGVLAAPGAWFLLSFTWWAVQALRYAG